MISLEFKIKDKCTFSKFELKSWMPISDINLDKPLHWRRMRKLSQINCYFPGSVIYLQFKSGLEPIRTFEQIQPKRYLDYP